MHNIKDIASFTLDRFRQVRAEFKILNVYTSEFVMCFRKMLRFSILMNNDCTDIPHFNFQEHYRNATSLIDELICSWKYSCGISKLGMEHIDDKNLYEILIYKIINILSDPNQLVQILFEFIDVLGGCK